MAYRTSPTSASSPPSPLFRRRARRRCASRVTHAAPPPTRTSPPWTDAPPRTGCRRRPPPRAVARGSSARHACACCSTTTERSSRCRAVFDDAGARRRAAGDLEGPRAARGARRSRSSVAATARPRAVVPGPDRALRRQRRLGRRRLPLLAGARARRQRWQAIARRPSSGSRRSELARGSRRARRPWPCTISPSNGGRVDGPAVRGGRADPPTRTSKSEVTRRAVEMRPRAHFQRNAVLDARLRRPALPVLAAGDDAPDEEMFAAMRRRGRGAPRRRRAVRRPWRVADVRRSGVSRGARQPRDRHVSAARGHAAMPLHHAVALFLAGSPRLPSAVTFFFARRARARPRPRVPPGVVGLNGRGLPLPVFELAVVVNTAAERGSSSFFDRRLDRQQRRQRWSVPVCVSFSAPPFRVEGPRFRRDRAVPFAAPALTAVSPPIGALSRPDAALLPRASRRGFTVRGVLRARDEIRRRSQPWGRRSPLWPAALVGPGTFTVAGRVSAAPRLSVSPLAPPVAFGTGVRKLPPRSPRARRGYDDERRNAWQQSLQRLFVVGVVGRSAPRPVRGCRCRSAVRRAHHAPWMTPGRGAVPSRARGRPLSCATGRTSRPVLMSGALTPRPCTTSSQLRFCGDDRQWSPQDAQAPHTVAPSSSPADARRHPRPVAAAPHPRPPTPSSSRLIRGRLPPRLQEVLANKLAIHALAVPGFALATALTAALLTPLVRARPRRASPSRTAWFASLLAATDPIAVVAPSRLARPNARRPVEGESRQRRHRRGRLHPRARLRHRWRPSRGVGGARLRPRGCGGALVGAPRRLRHLEGHPAHRRPDDRDHSPRSPPTALRPRRAHPPSGRARDRGGGMLCGNHGRRRACRPPPRRGRDLWEYVAFALNSVVFSSSVSGSPMSTPCGRVAPPSPSLPCSSGARRPSPSRVEATGARRSPPRRAGPPSHLGRLRVPLHGARLAPARPPAPRNYRDDDLRRGGRVDPRRPHDGGRSPPRLAGATIGAATRWRRPASAPPAPPRRPRRPRARRRRVRRRRHVRAGPLRGDCRERRPRRGDARG